MFKPFVTAVEDFKTLIANGLGKSMMQRCLQIRQFEKFENLRDTLLPVTYSTLSPGKDPIPNYLIRDPSCPLNPYWLTEYQSCSSKSEVIFNHLLRGAGNQAEYSFGRLKTRWCFPRRMVDLKLETVPVVVFCCFVPPSNCEMWKNCETDEQEVQAQIQRHKSNEEKTPSRLDAFYSYINSNG